MVLQPVPGQVQLHQGVLEQVIGAVRVAGEREGEASERHLVQLDELLEPEGLSLGGSGGW